MNTEQAVACAVEIGDRILAAEKGPDQPAPWLYALGEYSVPESGLYAGAAGIVHFLLPLYRLTREPRFLQCAERSGAWLHRLFTNPPPSDAPSNNAPPPGLYVGQAGPALALLELFETTGNPEFLDHCSAQAARIAEQPAEWMDLMNGPPGYGLLFLSLFRTTGEDRWRRALERCLADVDRTAEPYNGAAGGSGEGAVWPCLLDPARRWVTPGLAHGIAGVAVFLHAVSRATELPEEMRTRAAALGARVDHALLATAHERDGGLDWVHALEPPGDRFLVQWCHGAPGVAIPFLISPHPQARDTARAAGRVTIAAGDNRNQASQCHGVCGNAETFLELYRVTGEKSWLNEAHRFAEMAQDHRLPQHGPGSYRTHDTDELTFDLMTGIAGVGYFYLRLAHPDQMPYPIIGRWLV